MYCDVEDMLDWLNKSARPRLTKELREHIRGKILGGLPNDKDKGQPIVLIIAAKNPYTGNPCFYIFSDVVSTYPGATKKERIEVFCERYLNLADMKDLLKLHNVEIAKEHKHNERGAGRKPLPPDKIDAIRQCRRNGLSVRATAKFCCVSPFTVQRYSGKDVKSVE